MRQETGIRARRFRKRLKHPGKSEKKTLLDRPIKAYGMDRVRNQRLAVLNVFEFASVYGLDREDIEYLDRQLPATRKNVSNSIEKLALGLEVSAFISFSENFDPIHDHLHWLLRFDAAIEWF